MTRPDLALWPWTDDRFRRFERTVSLGIGDAIWHRATADVLRWKVKTRSGFAVTPPDETRAGARPTIVARVGSITIREPVEVVAVIRDPERVGFAYSTLPGHPVDGEEAFIVHRDGAGIYLTIRSLTRSARSGRWRAVYPVLRIAQSVVRRRYAKALR